MANESPIHYIDDSGYENGYGYSQGFCGVGNNLFNNPSGPVKGALLFDGIDIGQGETINMAEIKYIYSSVGSSSGSWKFNVWGIDEDSTADFSSNPFGRTKTSASVVVDEGPPTSGGTKTINVTSIVNEIVSRGGWSRYNPMGFTLEDNGSSSNVWATPRIASTPRSYLVYRVSAEPNFTPTPISVSAPSIPAAGNVGMKFSKPGLSVLTATGEDLYLNAGGSRKIPLIFDEDIFTADAEETVSIPHNLGYKPRVSVYAKETAPGDVWVRLPFANSYEVVPTYYMDEDNLYLYAPGAGVQMYYRIFLDPID